jgi:hypothetical protein
MKMYEIMLEQMQPGSTLDVLDDNDNETTLVDPKTKVKTVIPKDPNKPGMIAKNDKGQLTLNTKTNGTVDKGIKPGDKITVQ